MQDFKVTQKTDTTFDISVQNKLFETTSTIDTGINYQLFLNKRADKTQIATPRNRGGWMGDLITKPDYQSGSFIYTKYTDRNTQSNKNDIAEFAKLALKYFRKIGAKKITADVVENNIYGIINIDSDQTLKYSALWRVE